jgi:hypothetical protein
MLDPIQYELRFFQNTLVDPEPEPGARAETSIFRLWLQPKVSAPAPQPCSTVYSYCSRHDGSGTASLPRRMEDVWEEEMNSNADVMYIHVCHVS